MNNSQLTEFEATLYRLIQQATVDGELGILRATWHGQPACYLVSIRKAEGAGHAVRPLALLPADLAEMQRMRDEMDRHLTAALQRN